MTHPPKPHPDDESGRIMLFALGFVVIGLMLVAMVTAATAVHLDRKRLYNLADIAAAAAADSLDDDAYNSGTGLRLGDVSAAATKSIEQNVLLNDGAGHLSQIRVARATAPDGATAEITLTAVTNPPLLGWFTETFAGGIDLTATSAARAIR